MPETPDIEYFDEVDSTNDIALAAARRGAPAGSCYVADHQRAGRGRREVGGPQRSWHSPGGQSLYLSLLLRPRLTPDVAAPLTLAAALGVRRALARATSLDAQLWIKWPNDLYCGDRKLAGILTEGVMTGAMLDAVVVGVGINVNIAEFPEDLVEKATSIQLETGALTDRLALARAVREELLATSAIMIEDGLEPILDELRAHDRTTGRQVFALRGDREVKGVARGIDARGQLLVELEDGVMLPVHAGEVRFA